MTRHGGGFFPTDSGKNSTGRQTSLCSAPGRCSARRKNAPPRARPRGVALCGVQGWRWAWVRDVRALVWAQAAAAAGQRQGRALAREAALRGKRVVGLGAAAYGGHKDVNEAWVAGALTVGDWPASAGEGSTRLKVPADLQETWDERVAITVADGGLPYAEAECLVWAGLQTSGKEP